MNYRTLVLAISLAIVPTVSMAQSHSTSASRYGTSEALSVQDARLGEVLMVRQVTLQNDRSVNTGSAVGAAVGYAAGQRVDGSYRDAARVAGTVIGGVAGTSIQRRMSGRTAIEIYIRDFSNSGKVVVIVQDHTNSIQQGDRVFLVGSGNKTRVVRAPDAAEAYGSIELGSGSQMVHDGSPVGGGVVVGCDPFECQGTTRSGTSIGRSAR